MSDGYQVDPTLLQEAAQGINDTIGELKTLGISEAAEVGRGFSGLLAAWPATPGCVLVVLRPLVPGVCARSRRTRQLAQVQQAIQTDPGAAGRPVQKTRSVMDNMNAGTYGMARNRTAEMSFLIKALEKMG